MATSIIDALIVTLGLDASGFKKGKSEADAALKETRGLATSSAEEIAGAVGKVALQFVGLFTAVRGIGDVIGFMTNLNHEMATLGYTSRQLGESASNLRLYQQIAQGFGGSAQGITNTVSSLETAMFNMRQMGQMSGSLVAWQRFLGGLPPTNAAGGIDLPAAIAQARRATAGLSPMEATQRMKAAGLDDGTINAVLATTAELTKFADANKRSAAQVGANTEAAQKLDRDWLTLKNDAVGLSAVVLGQTTPSLEAMFGAIDKWVKNETFLDTLKQIGTALKSISEFATELQNGDWGKAFGGAAGGLWDWVKDGFNSPSQALGLSSGVETSRRASMAPLLSGLEKQYGLPAGVLDRIATAESHYVPGQTSSAGAVGLFGLMPQFHPGAGTNNNADAADAARTLASYYRQFGDWNLAIEAYNVGPGALRSAMRGKGSDPAGTMAAAARYHAKIGSIGSAPPTSSTRGPASLSIGNITINTQAKDANGIAADLAGAIRRKFNVFQTDAGLV